MFISYDHFKETLSKKIIEGEEFYIRLVETVIKNPNRYTGIFRITNAKTKLVQNVTQSNEIKFGDFMEDIVTEYINILGFENLEKNIGANDKGDILNTDQLFKDNKGNLFLVEQKIRDDHDSTKKRGQFDNFRKKVELLHNQYPDKKLTGVMWFIDAGLSKNKKYYSQEMQMYHSKRINLKLYYGGDIFKELLGSVSAWEEITSYLERNKLERIDEILYIPDFDTSEEILNALRKTKPNLIKKLKSDKPEYIQLRKELFPNNININKI